MDRRRPDQGWRAAAFAVALFAITLNFLQPLAHAAMMRDGGPQAAAALWGVFCLPTTQEDGTPAPVPASNKVHECCLGLAHAPVLAGPSPAFVAVELIATSLVFVADLDDLTPVGIRDGPHRPRGPPSHA
jgi:hypothetical protein